MKILICHERFLFRFGADRVLIQLGRGLSEMNHSVTFMGNRFDREILDPFAERIIECGAPGHFLNSNELTRDWLEANWNGLFDSTNTPDVVFVGGWPFISAIPFFRKVCRKVVFIDFGVVPNEGYGEQMVANLEKLRALRRRHLRDASLITPISNFIAESQSRPDSDNLAPIRSILLGADHLVSPRWQHVQFRSESGGYRTLDTVRSLKLQGKKILLALGRWEPGCYKNSDAAFQVVETLRATHPECVLLVLDHPSNIQVPDPLKDAVVPLGFPDDQELLHIMQEADLGLSVSLWEGFNLPLAEMQWSGRPTLAFNLGAHPEVVADPWYLCHDTAEMSAKAANLLEHKGPQLASKELTKFRSYFRWDRFISDYAEILQGMETMNNETGGTRAPSAQTNGSLSDAWKRSLYPGCICENWQMNDAERLALTGLLARHRPQCSIEVGTYHGGSLSLISQYSNVVFSIDIDETIPSRFHFPNVSFLTGPSNTLLPYLLAELDKADLPVEFMLIDGDHSATGVRNDISRVLAYVPKKPLFVALHDSFNPECRRGMLEAGWDRSPYCHTVELDFVPGKIADRQMWGGLALAHFLPVPRVGDLVINRAADEMFQIAAREAAPS